MSRASAISDLAEVGDWNLLARSFLETKLYEHPSWIQFALSEERALIGTPEIEWDEDWLQRLYLFNVVVLDSRLSGEHIAKIKRPVLMEDFFRRLVNNQVESLGKLLRAYAIQDAAAAFRLSEVSGIDLAQRYPEIVVISCDQEAFFRLVVEQAKSRQEGSDNWLALLVEAGLRYRIVAEWLVKEDAVAELEPRVEKLERRKQWPYKFAERNLFTQCTAIAMSIEPRTNPSLLRLVQEIDPAPRKSLINVLSIWCLLGTIVFVFAFIDGAFDKVRPVAIAVLILLIYVPVGMMMVFLSCRILYRDVLNQYPIAVYKGRRFSLFHLVPPGLREKALIIAEARAALTQKQMS
jgi:hypothetical protein